MDHPITDTITSLPIAAAVIAVTRLAFMALARRERLLTKDLLQKTQTTIKQSDALFQRERVKGTWSAKNEALYESMKASLAELSRSCKELEEEL